MELNAAVFKSQHCKIPYGTGTGMSYTDLHQILCLLAGDPVVQLDQRSKALNLIRPALLTLLDSCTHASNKRKMIQVIIKSTGSISTVLKVGYEIKTRYCRYGTGAKNNTQHMNPNITFVWDTDTE